MFQITVVYTGINDTSVLVQVNFIVQWPVFEQNLYAGVMWVNTVEVRLSGTSRIIGRGAQIF